MAQKETKEKETQSNMSSEKERIKIALSMTGPPFEMGLFTESDALEIQEMRKNRTPPKSNFEQIPLRDNESRKKG